MTKSSRLQIRRRDFLILTATGALSSLYASDSHAATAREIDTEASEALARLWGQNDPTVSALAKAAVGILVFPKIIKAGLIVGGEYGEGALRLNGRTTEYYTIAAASFGLQIGGQTFSYALLFMNQGALDYLRSSSGWSIGVGPSVVVLDEGMAKSITSTTITQDVVAIPFGQQGLMAGVGLEGSKISRLTPDK